MKTLHPQSSQSIPQDSAALQVASKATPPADLLHSIRELLLTAKAQVRQTVNTAMVQTYWHIGRMIVEDEQGGGKRATYGKQVLAELAKRLTDEFGSGFSVQSL